ncbi:hypothetical protein VNO77_37326 [Canavalia gladiata]|uniref:Uncharacterized protein n=1 Tax=Canavalia gladiata TaxID=3824 RepID=A0AAN9PYD9_CANGL
MAELTRIYLRRRHHHRWRWLLCPNTITAPTSSPKTPFSLSCTGASSPFPSPRWQHYTLTHTHTLLSSPSLGGNYFSLGNHQGQDDQHQALHRHHCHQRWQTPKPLVITLLPLWRLPPNFPRSPILIWRKPDPKSQILSPFI